MEPLHANLTDVSFNEFVAFLFDHEISPEEQKVDPWYCCVEVEFDPRKICAFYAQMFREPEFLLADYSKAQLEEGFWAIPSHNLPCSVVRVIDDSDLPLSDREECIRSMFDLFKRFFAVEPLDSSAHMWWDALCYDWHCGNRKRERGGEDFRLQDVYFETLARVLAIDSETCKVAALHGLGHLHHPHTKELIDRFIEEHPSLTPERKAYALAAAEFNVL
jgi:hypothetical protein